MLNATNVTKTQTNNRTQKLLYIQIVRSRKNLKSTGVYDGTGVEGWFGVVGVV